MDQDLAAWVKNYQAKTRAAYQTGTTAPAAPISALDAVLASYRATPVTSATRTASGAHAPFNISAPSAESGEGVGSRIIDILSRPLYATANLTKNLQDQFQGRNPEENALEAIGKGFTGEDKTTFKDVAAGAGVTDSTAQAVLGFAGDVLLDPTNLLVPGAVGLARKGVGAARGAGRAGKAAAAAAPGPVGGAGGAATAAGATGATSAGATAAGAAGGATGTAAAAATMAAGGTASQSTADLLASIAKDAELGNLKALEGPKTYPSVKDTGIADDLAAGGEETGDINRAMFQHFSAEGPNLAPLFLAEAKLNAATDALKGTSKLHYGTDFERPTPFRPDGTRMTGKEFAEKYKSVLEPEDYEYMIRTRSAKSAAERAEEIADRPGIRGPEDVQIGSPEDFVKAAGGLHSGSVQSMMDAVGASRVEDVPLMYRKLHEDYEAAKQAYDAQRYAHGVQVADSSGMTASKAKEALDTLPEEMTTPPVPAAAEQVAEEVPTPKHASVVWDDHAHLPDEPSKVVGYGQDPTELVTNMMNPATKVDAEVKDIASEIASRRHSLGPEEAPNLRQLTDVWSESRKVHELATREKVTGTQTRHLADDAKEVLLEIRAQRRIREASNPAAPTAEAAERAMNTSKGAETLNASVDAAAPIIKEAVESGAQIPKTAERLDLNPEAAADRDAVFAAMKKARLDPGGVEEQSKRFQAVASEVSRKLKKGVDESARSFAIRKAARIKEGMARYDNALMSAGKRPRIMGRKSQMQYPVSLGDVLHALPDEVAGAIAATGSAKGAKALASLHPTQIMSGAAHALDLASDLGMTAEARLASIKDAITHAVGPGAKAVRSTTVDLAAEAMAHPGFAAKLQDVMTSHAVEWGVADVREAEALTNFTTRSVLKILSDPTIAASEGARSVVEAARAVSANAKEMGASAVAEAIAQKQVADQLSKVVNPHQATAADNMVKAGDKRAKDINADVSAEVKSNVKDAIKESQEAAAKANAATPNGGPANAATAIPPPPGAAGAAAASAATGAAQGAQGAAQTAAGAAQAGAHTATAAQAAGAGSSAAAAAGAGGAGAGAGGAAAAATATMAAPVVDIIDMGEKSYTEISGIWNRFMRSSKFGYGTDAMGEIYRTGQSVAVTSASDFHNGLRKVAMAFDKQNIDEAWSALSRGTTPTDPVSLQAWKELKVSTDMLFDTSGTNPANGLMGVFFRNNWSVDQINKALKDAGIKHQFTPGPNVTPANLADQWKDWQIDDPLGELSKIYHAAAHTSMRHSLGADFSTTFGKSSIPAGANPKDWVKIKPNSSPLTEFVDSDLFYRRHDAEALHNLSRLDEMKYSFHDQKGLMASFINKVLDPSMAVFKPWMTIARPGHHVRNLVGDIFLNYMAGMKNPRYYRMATDIMSSAGRKGADFRGTAALRDIKNGGNSSIMEGIQSLKTPAAAVSGSGKVMLTVKGEKLTADNIYRLANQNGLLESYIVQQDLDDIAAVAGATGRKTGKVTTALTQNRYMEGMSKVSEAGSHGPRLAQFVSLLDNPKFVGKYKDLNSAVKGAVSEVRKWHPDVTGLTPSERKIMRRVIPFYSWIRQAIPLFLETLATHPGRITVVPKAYYNVAVAMGVNPNSLSDPWPQDKLIPSFLRDDAFGPIAGAMGINLGSPQEGILGDLLSGQPGEQWRNVMSMANPFIKAPIDLATGVNQGTGAKISDMSEYVDNTLPIVNQVSNISGVSATGTAGNLVGKIFGGDGPVLDPSKAMVRGEKDAFLNTSLVNFLTGLGLQNTQKQSYQNIAANEIRRGNS